MDGLTDEQSVLLFNKFILLVMNNIQIKAEVLPILKTYFTILMKDKESIDSIDMFDTQDSAVDQARVCTSTCLGAYSNYIKSLAKLLEPVKFVYSYQGVRYDFICGARLNHCFNYSNTTDEYQRNTSDEVIKNALLYQTYAHSPYLKDLSEEELSAFIFNMLAKILLTFNMNWTYVMDCSEIVDGIRYPKFKVVRDLYAKFIEHCNLISELYNSRESVTVTDKIGSVKLLSKKTEVGDTYHVSRYTKEELEELIARLGRPTIKEINAELGNEVTEHMIQKYLVKYGLLDRMNYKARGKGKQPKIIGF